MTQWVWLLSHMLNLLALSCFTSYFTCCLVFAFWNHLLDSLLAPESVSQDLLLKEQPEDKAEGSWAPTLPAILKT